jgi:hypothetical protein
MYFRNRLISASREYSQTNPKTTSRTGFARKLTPLFKLNSESKIRGKSINSQARDRSQNASKGVQELVPKFDVRLETD